jgi:alpha-glucosidase (family GH31 glycosyl hydrolase)
MPNIQKQAQVVIGKVRFTVVHRHCIRIEETESGTFTDEPTIFALERGARCTEARLEIDNHAVRIDTRAMRLHYRRDGLPLGPGNLSVRIRCGGRWEVWQPGKINAGNLGGTLATLDNVSGAVYLPEGLLSRDGWFLLDDSGRPVLRDGWAQARETHGTDWYLFGYGPDYRAAFEAFAAVSGPVPMPRRYALGAWYSRYWPYSSRDYRAIVREYERHRFPLDVMVMDMDWHINDSRRAPGAIAIFGNQVWTGYTWDKKLIQDPRKLLEDLHRAGLHVTLNDHPADGVQPHEEMYAAFMRATGHPAKGAITPFDAANRAYLEAFYEHTHRIREKEGVDFWWLDWQQRRETRGLPSLNNLEWLNHYYYEQSRAGGRRGLSFSRWGGWGDHRHPIHFSGDADTGWPMLAFEIPFTATAGNAGCFFWSHDIGGHQGKRNEESYTRWCQFGALSAALRSHSTRSPEMDRRPWTYPAWAERSMRTAFHLRSEWFPYLYTCAAQACRETFPFIRPMYLAEPEADDAYRNPQQFMLGDALLVAPIAEPGIGPRRLARQAVWLPKGLWHDVFTGERFEGPVERLAVAEIGEFPLYVRGGVPVPQQPYTPRMGQGVGVRLVVRCWPGRDGETGTSELYEDDGETEAYRRGAFARTPLACTWSRRCVTVEIGPTEGDYTGQPAARRITLALPSTVKPGKAQVNGKPVRVHFDARRRETRVTLPSASIRDRLVVTVQVSRADPAVNTIEAFARRAGLARRSVGRRNLAALVRSALSSGSPAAQARARRASGLDLFNKPESTCGYPGQTGLALYVPPGLQTSQKANVTAPGSTLVLPLAGAKTPITAKSLLARQPVPQNELMMATDLLPVEARLIIEGVETTLSASLTVDEPYWPFQRNLAPAARVTASSWMDDQPPRAAVDGIVDGLPGNRMHEWASRGEKAGAWIQLDWARPVNLSRVLLFDRPNQADHIVAGRLVFDNGDTLPVDELPADGRRPAIVDFPERRSRSLRFEITEVSPTTGWVGLSELAAYSAFRS